MNHAQREKESNYDDQVFEFGRNSNVKEFLLRGLHRCSVSRQIDLSVFLCECRT